MQAKKGSGILNEWGFNYITAHGIDIGYLLSYFSMYEHMEHFHKVDRLHCWYDEEKSIVWYILNTSIGHTMSWSTWWGGSPTYLYRMDETLVEREGYDVESKVPYTGLGVEERLQHLF